MARNKTKDWVIKSFSLDRDVSENIKKGAEEMGIKQGEYVEFLSNKQDEMTDPTAKLKAVRKEKVELLEEFKKLQEKQKQLDTQEMKMIESIETRNLWIKAKQKNRPMIIRNLMRQISEGRIEDADHVAKAQAIRMGCTAMELITEAMDNIQRGK